MPVREARDEARAREGDHGVAVLKRRAVAEVRDLLRHVDETCRACHAAGTPGRPPEAPRSPPAG